MDSKTTMAASHLTNEKAIIIHEDIIIHHILPKLPSRSLIRLQCVSKYWKSTIRDPNFKISPKHKTQALFIIPQDQEENSYEIYKLLNTNNILNPLRLEKPSVPLPSLLGSSIIWGSCNGLILFSVECDIFLCNPTTSYCQKVLELDFLCYIKFSVVTGFCYDPSKDDYVVLASFRQMSPGCNRPVISACLKSKRWRRVSFPYNVDSIKTGPILNNLLHWLASPETGHGWSIFAHSNSIIYFDVPSNGFKKLPSPHPIDEGSDDKLVGLEILADCLCVMRLVDDKGGVEVLVMKEYGVQESWATMFFIPCEYNCMFMEFLLCSWKVDAMLIRQNFDEGLHAYYPSTRTMEKIKVLCAPKFQRLDFRRVDDVIPYEETLVSPTVYHWNEEYDKKIASTEALHGYGLREHFDDLYEESLFLDH